MQAEAITVPRWQWPVPDPDNRVVGGVAAGAADELGVDPIWVRLAFVVWFLQGGWGLVLYLGAWALLNSVTHNVELGPRQAKARSSQHRLAGLALVVAGVSVLLAGWPGLPTRVMVPIGLVGAVGVVVYRATQSTRLVRNLDHERQARMLADERAEVAAHLHDSVLQTLTLIQKADDPAAVRHLARRQERELRNWLDPGRVDRQGRSLRGRLDELADDVEALHGVRVEVVVVGDCPVDDALEPLIGAAREAAVNSAKHAGVDRVDLFAEVGEGRVEIFVRDTGHGFDPAAIESDRLGISESIQGRMRRAGGTAHIESRPGGGTEVELSLPFEADEEKTS